MIVWVIEDDLCACIAICASAEAADYVLEHTRGLTDKWKNLRVRTRSVYTLQAAKEIRSRYSEKAIDNTRMANSSVPTRLLKRGVQADGD